MDNGGSAAVDQTWFAETMQAQRDSEERAAKREAALEKRLGELAFKLGGVEHELMVARDLNAQYSERLQLKSKAIAAALSSLEEHSRLNAKPADRDDEIIACVWETLEAVSS